jgi:PAS domain S-box-containing protein
MVHEEDRVAVEEQARQVLSGQDIQPLEHRIFRKNGLMRWIRNTLVPHYDSHGKPLSYDGLISDITDRKHAEEALRESEATLKSIFRAAPTGIGMVSDRVLKRVNDRICEMTGYFREELLEQSARMLYPTDEDFEYVGREKYRQIREWGTGSVEACWKRKDGKVIDVLLSSTAVDPNDLSAGVTFTALDITERKKAEEDLRESEDRYRRITEAITDYIYTVKIQDGRPVQTIHGCACVAVTGYTAEYFKENPYLWIQMVHEEDREAVEEQAARTLSGLKAPALEHRIIRKDGATRWVRNTPVLNFDNQGRLLSCDGLVQDVTERKQAEEALRKAHDELERFNLELEQKVQERIKELKQKNKQLVEAERLAAIGKITNRVAHELRNPLTVVGGFARRISQKTPADDPNKKYLQIILDEVIAMESKVSEITRIRSQ